MKSKTRQTRAPNSKGKPLEVRRYLRRHVDGIPRTEMMCNGEWVPCKGFVEARKYAAANGYAGISIKPV